MRPPTYISLSLTFLSCASIAIAQCTLNIPQNPLTAQGLATPYELTGCNQLDFANQGVFVEAAIIDPATGQIQIYNPLVINAGMTAVGTTSNTSTSASTSKTSTSASTSASTSKSSSSSSSASTTSSSSSVKISITGTTSSTTSSSTTPSSSSSVKTNTGASTIASTHTTSAGATLTQVARAAATTGAGFFIPPIVPTLPANAVVALWFGSNAQTVTLTGDTATCVNGLGTSVFGQFAYCNAPAWFSAANTAVQNGLTKVLAPGTGSGQACPTIRDFRIVDQDQSDNVVTTYLMIGTDTLAQNTPANSKANPNAEVLSNASDNALISEFIQPSLGCTAYSNPCTTCPSGQSPALATNELQASYFPPVGGPAMVPLNDPMVLVNGQQSLQKVNLYRSGVNQAQADNANASGTTYCQQYAQSGLFISLNQQLFSGKTSPAADQATNLFTFLAMRFSMSFGPVPGLACTQLLNVANPVTLTTDGNGVVTAATINTQALQQILGGVTTTSTATTSATQSGVRLVSTSGATTATLSTMTASNTSATHSSTQSVSASTAVTTSKATSATHLSTQSVSASTVVTTSKATSATHSSTQSVSASTVVTTSKATSATHSSTQSVSASTVVTTSKATSATHLSTQSVSSSTALTTSKATSATHSSVQSTSVPSVTAIVSTPATSATHSSSLLVSTSARTATTTSATTTSHPTTTSVAVTSPTTVATGITSSGVCTSTVTVTVTATVCSSSTSQPTSQPTSHHYSGQGGGRYWLRGLPAREHSRMQKKNRHSSDW